MGCCQSQDIEKEKGIEDRHQSNLTLLPQSKFAFSLSLEGYTHTRSERESTGGKEGRVGSLVKDRVSC